MNLKIPITNNVYLLNNALGNHNAISGKNVINAAAMHINRKKGAEAIATFIIGAPVSPCIINKLNPIGGVTWANSTIITKKIPNHTGSNPAARTKGSVMGRLMTVIEIPSKNKPSKI